MASIQSKFGVEGGRGLRISYTCNAAIVGGQLVARVAGNRLVDVAGANSPRVVGVAQWDVPVSRGWEGGPQVGDGHELTVIRLAVVPVTFTGAAVAGDKLIAAASGAVAVAGAAPDSRFIVGEAFEDVAGAGVGKALIY
jgi:hypothetical protein